MSTAEDYLADVEQREQAATPGLWEVDGSLIQGSAPGQAHIGQTWGIRWHADAEFIAAARTDVPRMVEALRRALAWADLQARPFPNGTPDREGEAVAAGLRDVITEALGGEQA